MINYSNIFSKLFVAVAVFVALLSLTCDTPAKGNVKAELADVLLDIEKNDTNYDVRYNLVLKALFLAKEVGHEAGMRIDRAEPDWPVAQIELPTGQVSWHMPAHKIAYDGHTNDDKFERILNYSNHEGAKNDLADVLLDIKENDTNYDVRYNLVLKALSLAKEAGYEAGFRIDRAEPDWPVAQIELPTGQVSWHMPAHKTAYDGHTNEQKFARIHKNAGMEE